MCQTNGSLGWVKSGKQTRVNSWQAPKARPISPSPFVTDRATSEAYLAMQVCEHILSLLAQMAVVIERSPQAFRTMGEEDLRFVLLVPLNTHYEGRASAEAFNFEGKTDILIREMGKNVFVAECKFWDGPESLRRAIDQLLGYACCWDTKTALLLFNRGRQLSTVLAKISPNPPTLISASTLPGSG
jgi:hypothetical protein